MFWGYFHCSYFLSILQNRAASPAPITEPRLHGCWEDTAVSAAQRAALLQGCPSLCSPTEGSGHGPAGGKGHLPPGWPSPGQCQHRRAALGQEQNQGSAIHWAIAPARGDQLPDRLQHISVASVSIMKSVSTPRQADGAGLDETHTHTRTLFTKFMHIHWTRDCR